MSPDKVLLGEGASNSIGQTPILGPPYNDTIASDIPFTSNLPVFSGVTTLKGALEALAAAV